MQVKHWRSKTKCLWAINFKALKFKLIAIKSKSIQRRAQWILRDLHNSRCHLLGVNLNHRQNGKNICRTLKRSTKISMTWLSREVASRILQWSLLVTNSSNSRKCWRVRMLLHQWAAPAVISNKKKLLLTTLAKSIQERLHHQDKFLINWRSHLKAINQSIPTSNSLKTRQLYLVREILLKVVLPIKTIWMC